jgi:hypothetical protein
MKKILVTALTILFTAGVYAQTSAPNELTCTERAFNFTFSLGSKWKITTPKMGPAEVTREELDYFPAWTLKHNEVTAGTQMPLNVNPLLYSSNQQNYTSVSYYNSFNLIDKSIYLFPGRSFNPPINYILLKPDAPVNSIGYKH